MQRTFECKKRLGQHFLQDHTIAQHIVASLVVHDSSIIIEIGPGQGALTQWLVNQYKQKIYLVEKDARLVNRLRTEYTRSNVIIVHDDFLQWPFPSDIAQVTMIGNLPYNISSQIFFKVIHGRQKIASMVCMVQEEVARRIVAPPGKKQYGILSVLLQAFYKIEYLLTVPPTAFEPPPKVFSGLLRLTRHSLMSYYDV